MLDLIIEGRHSVLISVKRIERENKTKNSKGLSRHWFMASFFGLQMLAPVTF